MGLTPIAFVLLKQLLAIENEQLLQYQSSLALCMVHCVITLQLGFESIETKTLNVLYSCCKPVKFQALAAAPFFFFELSKKKKAAYIYIKKPIKKIYFLMF